MWDLSNTFETILDDKNVFLKRYGDSESLWFPNGLGDNTFRWGVRRRKSRYCFIMWISLRVSQEILEVKNTEKQYNSKFEIRETPCCSCMSEPPCLHFTLSGNTFGFLKTLCRSSVKFMSKETQYTPLIYKHFFTQPSRGYKQNVWLFGTYNVSFTNQPRGTFIRQPETLVKHTLQEA